MNMKKVALASALSIITSAAFADGAAFDGVNAQLGLGFASLGSNLGSSATTVDNYTSGSYSSTSSYTEGESGSVSQKGILGNIALGYSYGLPNDFNIAANVFYNFGSQNAGQKSNGVAYSMSDNQGYSETGGTNQSLQAKLKNIWGISVEPGYYFTKSTLGFLKLGWAMASSSLSENYSQGYQASDGYSESFSANRNANFGTSSGFLYGLGLKQMIVDNVYLGIDVYQISFNTKSTTSNWSCSTDCSSAPAATMTSRPNYTYGGISIGYKF